MDLTQRDEWARFYRAKQDFAGLNRWFNRYVIERDLYEEMAAVLPQDSSAQLIEMGCANSDWLPHFATEHGYGVAGIDYLDTGCRLAEGKLERAGCSNHKIYSGDFRALHETVGRRFDVLVSFGVIEHFDDPASLLETFGGYLRSGGLMITVCPNTAGYAMHLQKHVDRAVYDGHLRFRLEDLADYHRRAGLHVERSSYLGLLSLNNLDFSGYRSGRALKTLVKLANAPLVAACHVLRKLGLPATHARLSASMFVAARKP